MTTPDSSDAAQVPRAKTAAALLRDLAETPPLAAAVVDRLDEIQRCDASPEDPWHQGSPPNDHP